MRAAAALLCLVVLGSACTLQESDQEKNRKLLLGAVEKAASSAVEFGTYRHLTVTAPDGTVTETKLEIAGLYQSKSFTGQVGLIDNKTDKETALYDYLVSDGQPYIKPAGTTVWRRPVPSDSLPSGDPGMGTLTGIVRRAVSIAPYHLAHYSNNRVLTGYYHQFTLGLAAQDVEALLGIKLSEGEEPLFLKSASSRLSVMTASVDERLAAVAGLISGTVPATKTKISLEMQTIFLSGGNQRLVAPPQEADPQKDRELVARALQAADTAGAAFSMTGAIGQGNGDTAQVQADGFLKSGLVAMRYSVTSAGHKYDYDIILDTKESKDIYVRPAGQSGWSVTSGAAFTWLMPLVKLDLLRSAINVSSTISSALRVPQASFDSSPTPPPFVQPLFSGLVRDSGPGGSDNQYVVTLKPDQMAQLLLSDQSSTLVEKYSRSIQGEVDVFLYPFGDRLAALSTRLQVSEPRDDAYRSTTFSAVFKPENVDAIAVPANAVRTTPAKIFNF